MVKPVLGLMPERIWKELRLKAVEAAINRYLDAGIEVPKEWGEEQEKLFEELYRK